VNSAGGETCPHFFLANGDFVHNFDINNPLAMKRLTQIIRLIPVLLLFQLQGCGTGKFSDLIDLYTYQDTVGTIKWTFTLDGDYKVFGALAADKSGNIIASIGGGTGTWKPAKLIALAPDGNQLWNTQELDHNGAGSPVVSPDGTIYVSGYYKLYAFHSDGSLKWSHEFPEAQIGQPKVAPDGTVFINHVGSGSYIRRFFALNPEGEVIWATPEKVSHFCNGLTIHPSGFIVFFDRSFENPYVPTFQIAARDLQTGIVQWTYQLPDGTDNTLEGFALTSDGNIVIPLMVNGQTQKASLLILNSEGNLVQQITLYGNQPGLPSIASDGTIFMTQTNKGLEARDRSGVVLWDKQIPIGRMVAIDKRNNIYLTSGEGTRIYSSTGELLEELEIPSNGTSPLITGSGNVFVASEGYPGKISAFKGYAGINSCWPRGYGNNQNTGGR
jgi:hypothetical protein